MDSTGFDGGVRKVLFRILVLVVALWAALGHAITAHAADADGANRAKSAANVPIWKHLNTEERAWLKQHARIKVGIMADWPPFNRVDQNGVSRGISAEIIAEVGRQTGLEIELVPGVWKDIYPQLVEQKIDALMDVTPKPAREPLMNFTHEYLSIPHAIIAQKDSTPFRSETALEGRVIALEKGFGNVKWFRDNHPGVTIKEYPTTRDCLDAVARGEVDAYVGNRAVATYIMKQEVMHNLTVHGRLSRAPTLLAIGVRKDVPVLQGILEKGLQEVEGLAKQDILTRWTGLAMAENEGPINLSPAERAWLRDNPVVSAANEMDWPPFDFAENGEPQGLTIDVLNLAADKVGLRVEWVNGYRWAELMTRFNAGEIDLLPALYWTEERSKTIDYTSPYIANSSVLALRDDHLEWSTLGSLKGRKVGIVEGFATADLLAARYPDVELVAVRNVEDGLQQVSFGTIDAFFGSLGVVSHTLENHVIPNIRLSKDPGVKSGRETELRIGVLKSTPYLRDIIQKGLNAITDGEMREIRQRWVPIELMMGESRNRPAVEDIAIPETEDSLFLLIAGVAVAFVLVAWLMRAMLKSSRYRDFATQVGSPKFRFMLIGGLAILVVLVLMVSWVAFQHNQTRMRASVGVNIRTVLTSTAERLQIWREEKTVLAERLSEIPDVVSNIRKLIKLPRGDASHLRNAPEQEALLSVLRRNKKGQGDLGYSIIAQDGTILTSVNASEIGTLSAVADAFPQRLNRAFQGERVFVPTMFVKTGEPVVHILVPIKDAYSRVYAVFAQALDPAVDFTRILQTGLIGATGETYAFDRNGRMMSSSRFEGQLVDLGVLKPGQHSILNVTLHAPSAPAGQLTYMARSAISGRSSISLEPYRDYRDVDVIGAWIWFDEWGMGIATEIDAEEAFESISTLRTTFIFIVGLTLTLSVSAVLFTLALGERTSRVLLRAKEELEDRVVERTREVQEQRDLMLAVMDAMTVGVVAFDKDLKLITWNQNYLDVRGYPEGMIHEGAAFETLTRYDVEHNEFGAGDPEAVFMETVGRARQFEPHSFERQRPNGTYIEVRGGPIAGGGFVSIFSDITARKKTERALNVALEENKRQTERFRNLTSNLPAMVFQFMSLGPEQIYITYASPFMCEMFEFGDADENDLTEIFYDRLHEDDDVPVRRAFAEVIAKKGFFKETFRIRKTTGEVRWLEAAARCYEVTDGFMQWDGLILDITDRMAAEDALRKNEAMLNEMLSTSPVGATIVRLDGTLEFFNQRMADMVGMTNEQMENIVARDLYVDPAQRDAITQKLINHEPVRDEEITLKHQAGHPVYALLTLQEMPSRNGYFGWIYDITERKRFLEALAESEEQTRLILESAGEGIFGLTTDGVTEFVNPTACAILGYMADELVGEGMHEMVHHSYPDGTPYPSHDCHMFAAFKEGKVHRITDEVLWRKDGTAVPVEYTATPIRKDGRVTGSVVTFQDITKRKEAEDALRESQQLLQGVIENSAAVIFFKDKYGVYQLVNRRWEEVTGVAREEAIGKSDFEIFPKEVAEQLWNNDLEVIKRLEQIESEERIERHGEQTYFLSLKFPLVDAQGNAEGICGLSTDITDRKRMEAEITDARDKAESATRAKSAFLAAMSHEIRTPMNGVVGMIDLLRETELNIDQAQMMTTVRDSAFALLQIINDILDFSKIEAGKLVLERIPVSARDVIEGVSETLIPNATAKKVRFVNFIDPAIPHWVLTDQVRLRQILFNLLGNAIKFTETTDEHPGLVKLMANLDGEVENGMVHVKFSIIDNGIGMSEEAVNNLFKPFTQAESSTTRRFGGTGLGLSISKSLADMMGGEIKVESVQGEGSTFSVVLPFQVDDTHPAPLDEPSLEGLRMLLVCGEELFFEHIPPYVAGRGGTYAECRDLFATERQAEQAAVDGAPFDIVVFGSRQVREQVDGVITDMRQNTNLKGLRFVILTSDRKSPKGMILPDEVVVDTSPMKRSRFLHALGVASGRCSPDVETGHEKLTAGVAKAPSPDEAAAQHRLILVVEDNKTNQDVIRRQLNALGYACELSDNGQEGLDAWGTGRYSLVLTDCHMPEMDGYEMTTAIRGAEKQDGDIDHTPIIAITANALQGEGDRCLATGMDDYLTKPLEMALLKQTLAKWMPASITGDAVAAAEAQGSEPTLAAEPETAEHPAADTSVVNPSYLRETFGDDEELIADILRDFPAPSRNIIAEIDAAFAAKDAVAVGKAGHKLKSSSRAVGADSLADLCYELEMAGKSGDFAKIETLYAQLHPAFDAVTAYIEAL